MASKESYFGPFPPEPEPEEYGTPCPNCGGPRLARDADRWCESCRKGIGCYAEFVCGWYPELVPAKDTCADWRESQRRKLSDFYEFSELAREAVGHAEFTETTLKKLEALLLRPKADGGMFDDSAGIGISPRERLLRTRRSEIMAFLRKRLQGNGEPNTNGKKSQSPPAEAEHLKRLLAFLTGGVSEERIREALAVLWQKDSVDSKLRKLDELGLIPDSATGPKLGALLGVTKQAISDTPWWNARNERAKEEAVERQDLHRERSKQMDGRRQ